MHFSIKMFNSSNDGIYIFHDILAAVAGSFIRLWTAAAIAVILMTIVPAFAKASDEKEITFGILEAGAHDEQASAWRPFISDMEKQTGIKVNMYFARDHANLVDAMRLNKVQLAWFDNKSCVEAVDRSDAEIFAQVIDKDGRPGYWSYLITGRNSNLESIKDLVKHSRKYSFGYGDPNTSAGYLIPSYYAFAMNNIDPSSHFKSITISSNESNAVAVAVGEIDFATADSIDMERFRIVHPDLYPKIRIFRKSSLIPSDPIAWRKDLPSYIKAGIKRFFLSYGKNEREQKILANMQNWGRFRESGNDQLISTRQIELYQKRVRTENDEEMGSAEKEARLSKINKELSRLSKKEFDD